MKTFFRIMDIQQTGLSHAPLAARISRCADPFVRVSDPFARVPAPFARVPALMARVPAPFARVPALMARPWWREYLSDAEAHREASRAEKILVDSGFRVDLVQYDPPNQPRSPNPPQKT
jgi:hypothetical protein